MSYVIEYEPEAFTDLERLTKSVQKRVVKKINWLAENFDRIKPQSLTARFIRLLQVENWRLPSDL
jgi:mRNA interferase RelE/StbE